MKKRVLKKIAMLMVIVFVLSSCALQAFAVEYEGAGDLIRNHTFDNGVGFPWRVVESYPATADYDITADGKYKITITKIGAAGIGQRWDVQFLHRGLSLVNGHTYTIKFTVTASRACKIYPKIGDQGDPYEEYWNMNQQWQFLELQANVPKTVTATFIQTKGDKKNVEFAFHLAPDICTSEAQNPASFQPITFTFDDIYVADPQFAGYPAPIPEPTNVVRLNQEGFYPNADKIATVVSSSTTPINWQLVNSAGTAVLTGKSTVKGADHASGDNVHIIDFSSYKTAGTGYKIVTDVPVTNIGDNGSMPFNISNDIYSKMKYDSMKYFYHNRSGIPIKMPFCDQPQLARPAGHTNDILAPDPTKDYRANYTLDVTGGWYDAGDFGKYVVKGGISTWTLMNSYERALYLGDTSVVPFIDGSLNIPESGNGFPDILDEARYNLNTLLNMQVPTGNTLAGMVHYKAGDERWLQLAIRPDQDTMKRYLQPPSTAATLNLAAIAAQGSRLWKQYDAAFATKCLTAAETAWDAAVEHPDKYIYINSVTGIGTNGENYFLDDFYWAACELYATTGSNKYLNYINSSPHYLQEPSELTAGDMGFTGCFDLDNTAGMGTITLALVPNGLPAADIAKAKANIQTAADKFISIEKAQGYGVPIEEKVISSRFDQSTVSGFPCGSNSFVINEAIVMSYAYLFSNKNTKYINGAITAMDYILGRNPNVQSYVTGYGDNPLENPHHRFWAYQADNSFPHPPAGCMSGGPNSGLQDSWVKSLGWQPGKVASEKCFLDNIESWSTNEIAINWNAPLAWVSAFLDEEGRVICGGDTLGDINGDGQRDALDFALIKKALLNGDTSIQNADVNNDGSVDAMDLALYKSFLLGKVNF
ncbi:glycoside hydrolase family 9 protein [Ruminiclostridium cellulolyticum]|uniref:Endoglucanase n=1 Tax=Ruminiclostridium cellulolyticum (strain ATCC 35319 / DSM 5812 / JCM 6584 / H10) TaxID=394503 RepID=B8I5I9_RUMCH|nr:glycoside hydrolase family 9 protein [Ruminiclostridium cellulolyticum]ACL76725.1 glycoside hydrolase family 9 [Ruminiclostridium cellulolyticum H10]